MHDIILKNAKERRFKMRKITTNFLKLRKLLSTYAPAYLFGFSFYALFGRKPYLLRGF